MVDSSNETATPSSPPSGDGEPGSGAGTKALGLDRWVQFAFIAGAAVAVWTIDNILFNVWNNFAEPNPTVVTLIAVVISVFGAFFAYRHPTTRGWANEVAVELSQVTWPGRQETWQNTLVTVITSAIAAVILFSFDYIWSAVTDFIY